MTKCIVLLDIYQMTYYNKYTTWYKNIEEKKMSKEEKINLIYGLFQVLKKNKKISGEREIEKRLIAFVLEIQDKLDEEICFD